MALTAGTRIGSYEVLAPLGAGGMGEVYRARDAQLKRDVALKVLPDVFAADPERLARFRREAELLASLNHPHIATVYGLERSDTATAIVLELVEGDTLADLIARGRIAVPEALPIARQIAEALEAAHERGIVHRDLKPANIKLTPEGRVKVLDFGLAKMLADEGPGVSPHVLSMSPTLTSPAATFAGTILGTAAYMAPEQAKGAAVDRRADLFAFGCVLYEMLAGRPAFDGATVTEVLAGVLKSEPDWTALPADVPAAVRRLLRRCLAKDRHQRLQSAGDARLELTEAMGAEEAAALPLPEHPPRRTGVLWQAATALLAVATVALGAYVLRPVEAPRELRLDVAMRGAADAYSFALSPDGRHVVYEALGDDQPQLWLRPLDSGEARALGGTQGATRPFWSPDGRAIGFVLGGSLRRMDLTGSSSQALAEIVGARGMAWGPDVILFSPNSVGPLAMIPATGGPVTEATALAQGHLSHRFPQFIPGSRRFIFFVQGNEDSRGVYLGSLDSREVRRLLRADTSAAVLPPDRLVFVRNSTLLAQQVDFDRGEVRGEPITIATSVENDAGTSIGAFSTSTTGIIAYRAGGAAPRRLAWFDRTGKALGSWGPVEPGLMHPEISPDGRYIAIDREAQTNVDVWVVDALRMRRLTFDPRQDHWPVWSPDGKTLAYDSDRNTTHDLFERPADGGGEERTLLLSKDSKGMTDWSRDGTILFTANVAGHAFDLLWMRRDGDTTPKVFLGTPADERHAQFSPDGRWVAYISNESGRYEVYVRPFPGPGGHHTVSTAGGIAPRWSADGREIYYVAPDGSIVAAPVTTAGGTFEAGSTTTLFRPRIVFGGVPTAKQQFDVGADGRFLINVVADDRPQPPITLVLNWNPPRTP